MKDNLIIYETAKLAKDRGFDWDCYFEYEANDSTYREGKPAYSTVKIKKGDLTKADEGLVFKNLCDNFSAPTQSLLQKWLRDKHGILLFVNYRKYAVVNSSGYYFHVGDDVSCYIHGKFETYEEALEAGLQEALKLIK